MSLTLNQILKLAKNNEKIINNYEYRVDAISNILKNIIIIKNKYIKEECEMDNLHGYIDEKLIGIMEPYLREEKHEFLFDTLMDNDICYDDVVKLQKDLNNYLKNISQRIAFLMDVEKLLNPEYVIEAEYILPERHIVHNYDYIEPLSDFDFNL